MMPVQKHLHELLKEDQEPFILRNYMIDRKLVKKQKDFPKNFCKNACFFSFHDSPEMRRSPLFDFQSPAKTPCGTPNCVFLKIPAKTLNTNNGFGLFGSLLKKLTNRNRKHEIGGDGVRVTVKKPVQKEEESSDLEASTSNSLYEFESVEKKFCESPFRFVLQRSPSSGTMTPELGTPAASPCRHREESSGAESLKKLQEKEEEEEEKKQNSPVSVLDPPFEDDDDRHDDNGKEDHNFDLGCNFGALQRTKQQLLRKLCRFERLAGLDPIELEKTISEQEDDVKVEESNNHGYTRRIPEDFKRLLSDLIGEEGTNQLNENGREDLPKRVCKRLEKWKEVEMNTIDMMVEQDFVREFDMWSKNSEQMEEIGMEIEDAIFGLLSEELLGIQC